MTELRSRVGERERKRERSKERGNEERNGRWYGSGWRGIGKRAVGGGKGGMWQRWELYRPRRTAGLYPLSSLCPHHLALWNEHYTSRWRTVEEYPRYFSLSRSTSRFLLRFSSSFSLVLFLPFFPFCLSFFVFLSLLSLFSFLRVPLPPIRTTLASSFVFFFSSLFIVLHFFSSFLAYTPILDSGVCSSPVETRMKEKERRKRRMGRETW